MTSDHAALCLAVSYGRVAIAKTLVEAKILDLNAECGDQGKTLLYIAVEYDRIEIVGILVDAGADPNARGDTDETVLCLGISYDRVESVGILVKAGVDINANCGYKESGRSEWTPLYAATYYDRSSIAKILVDAGARR